MPAGKAAERFLRKHSDNYQQNLSENLNLIRSRLGGVFENEGASETAASEPAASEPEIDIDHNLRLCDLDPALSEEVLANDVTVCRHDDISSTLSSYRGKLDRSCRSQTSQTSSESGSTRLSETERYGHIWQANSDASTCTNQQCDVKFGIMNRRHHCRLCGFIFCDKCAPKRVLHERTSKHSRLGNFTRACDECFQAALAEAQHIERDRHNLEAQHAERDRHIFGGEQLYNGNANRHTSPAQSAQTSGSNIRSPESSIDALSNCDTLSHHTVSPPAPAAKDQVNANTSAVSIPHSTAADDSTCDGSDAQITSLECGSLNVDQSRTGGWTLDECSRATAGVTTAASPLSDVLELPSLKSAIQLLEKEMLTEEPGTAYQMMDDIRNIFQGDESTAMSPSRQGPDCAHTTAWLSEGMPGSPSPERVLPTMSPTLSLDDLLVNERSPGSPAKQTSCLLLPCTPAAAVASVRCDECEDGCAGRDEQHAGTSDCTRLALLPADASSSLDQPVSAMASGCAPYAAQSLGDANTTSFKTSRGDWQPVLVRRLIASFSLRFVLLQAMILMMGLAFFRSHGAQNTSSLLAADQAPEPDSQSSWHEGFKTVPKVFPNWARGKGLEKQLGRKSWLAQREDRSTKVALSMLASHVPASASSSQSHRVSKLTNLTKDVTGVLEAGVKRSDPGMVSGDRRHECFVVDVNRQQLIGNHFLGHNATRRAGCLPRTSRRAFVAFTRSAGLNGSNVMRSNREISGKHLNISRFWKAAAANELKEPEGTVEKACGISARMSALSRGDALELARVEFSRPPGLLRAQTAQDDSSALMQHVIDPVASRTPVASWGIPALGLQHHRDSTAGKSSRHVVEGSSTEQVSEMLEPAARLAAQASGPAANESGARAMTADPPATVAHEAAQATWAHSSALHALGPEPSARLPVRSPERLLGRTRLFVLAAGPVRKLGRLMTDLLSSGRILTQNLAVVFSVKLRRLLPEALRRYNVRAPAAN